jgi:hypothetical protein
MRRGVRTASKWVLSVVTLLIGVAWPLSLRYFAIHGDSMIGVRCVGISMGTVWYAVYEFGVPGWEVGKATPPIRCNWWFTFKWNPEDERMVFVPLWAPLACSGAATGLLWWPDVRRRWRRRSRRCASCGYDRRGLAADAKCPECGTAPSAR